MIVNLRGTSGSGKTHTVRSVMAAYGPPKPLFIKGRKRPLLYRLPRQPGSSGRPLSVLGHYETACGGCDTICKIDDIFGRVYSEHERGHDVLFEGLLISAELKRTLKLWDDFGDQFLCVALGTPIEDCLAGIQARRDARGDIREIKPTNTISKHKGVVSAMKRFGAEGRRAETHSRATAAPRILEFFDVAA